MGEVIDYAMRMLWNQEESCQEGSEESAC